MKLEASIQNFSIELNDKMENTNKKVDQTKNELHYKSAKTNEEFCDKLNDVKTGFKN